MSILAIAWALKQKTGSPISKLILLKLADNYNEGTGLCCPSMDHISEQTELSKASVKRHIKTLETNRLLQIEERKIDGVNLSNVYRLAYPENFIPDRGGVTQTPGGGVTQTPGVGSHRPPNQNHEPESIEPYTSDWPSDVLAEDGEPPLSVKEFIESWNEDFKDKLPLVRLPLSESRKRKVAARLKEHPDLVFWQRVFANIERSRFLLGGNGKGNHEGWRCTLDFVVANDRNCVKIWEGQYNREQVKERR